MSKSNFLTRKVFNQNIREIKDKSKLIDNNWHLIETNNSDDHENEPINYLESIEQTFLSGELLTITLHVVYSSSFNVPVLYLNINKSNGKLLNYQEMYDYFNLNMNSDEREDGVDVLMTLTQQEHPILFKPYYFIHPCKTSKWMSTSSLNNEYNYTLKWMSFVFSAFGLKLNIKYGMK